MTTCNFCFLCLICWQVGQWLAHVPDPLRGRGSPGPNISSPVFVIYGGPGEGKSALLAHLWHTFYDDVVAVHACKFSDQQTTVARRIVLWIVYQVCRSLPAVTISLPLRREPTYFAYPRSLCCRWLNAWSGTETSYSTFFPPGIWRMKRSMQNPFGRNF